MRWLTQSFVQTNHVVDIFWDKSDDICKTSIWHFGKLNCVNSIPLTHFCYHLDIVNQQNTWGWMIWYIQSIRDPSFVGYGLKYPQTVTFGNRLRFIIGFAMWLIMMTTLFFPLSHHQNFQERRHNCDHQGCNGVRAICLQSQYHGIENNVSKAIGFTIPNFTIFMDGSPTIDFLWVVYGVALLT